MEVYERRHYYSTGAVICNLQNMRIDPQDHVFINIINAKRACVYFKEPHLYSSLHDLKTNKFTENSLINVWEF